MHWPNHRNNLRLGVLMLDTAFPRPVGDIGNPETYPFPVDYLTIDAANADTVVRAEGPAAELKERFLAGAQELIEKGATVLATSCGFLSVYQAEFEQRLTVPFVASALKLLPALHARYGPSSIIGIITFDARALTLRHLPETTGEVVIEGLENGSELYPVIKNDRTTLDRHAAEADAVAAARRLAAHRPRPAAILLECTNLPPYRDAIECAAGVPVFDVRDAIATALPS